MGVPEFPVRAFGKRFDGCPGISSKFFQLDPAALGVPKSAAEIREGSWVSRNPGVFMGVQKSGTEIWQWSGDTFEPSNEAGSA